MATEELALIGTLDRDALLAFTCQARSHVDQLEAQLEQLGATYKAQSQLVETQDATIIELNRKRRAALVAIASQTGSGQQEDEHQDETTTAGRGLYTAAVRPNLTLLEDSMKSPSEMATLRRESRQPPIEQPIGVPSPASRRAARQKRRSRLTAGHEWRPLEQWMRIEVVTLHGRRHQMRVSYDETVEGLLAELSPSDQNLRVLFGGKLLEPRASLRAEGIREGSLLRLLPPASPALAGLRCHSQAPVEVPRRPMMSSATRTWQSDAADWKGEYTLSDFFLDHELLDGALTVR